MSSGFARYITMFAFHVGLAFAAMAFAAPGDQVTTEVRTQYESELAKTGGDAESQIQLGLWCEAHGLTTERTKHLTIAVLTDPKNATARGLLGMVNRGGKWRRPEAVAAAVDADPIQVAKMAEYRRRRQAITPKADDHWRLGLWCEENGLAEEAGAHFTHVLRMDSGRDAAWRKLGFRKVGKRWVTDAKLEAERLEADAQKTADRFWKPRLQAMSDNLRKKTKQESALLEMAKVTDPRAVPAILAIFVDANQIHQSHAVMMLSQIDAAEASRALASLGFGTAYPEVRRIAAESLRQRDPREYADLLIAMIRDPIKYKVTPFAGTGSVAILEIETSDAKVRRRYSSPQGPNVTDFQSIETGSDGSPVGVQSLGLTPPQFFLANNVIARPGSHRESDKAIVEEVRNKLGGLSNNQVQGLENMIAQSRAIGVLPYVDMKYLQSTSQVGISYKATRYVPIGQHQWEVEKTLITAANQLQADIATMEDMNRLIQETNDAVELLIPPQREDRRPVNRRDWDRWWVDQVGFANMINTNETEKPTIVEDVPINYTPVIQTATVFSEPIIVSRMSCFGAGTLVQTLAGKRPIESLAIGDQVLTQSTQSGRLDYKPITHVHRNPPSPTFEIAFGSESVVSSPFHRFWKVGHGWVMARDIHVGDVVRTLDGPLAITQVESGKVQLVFNLDVADDHDFFVGTIGTLVHDNSLPDLRLKPFDAPTAIAIK